MKTLTKEEAAEDLAAYHFEIDEDVRAFYRILSESEDDPNEPLKLLKVSEDTPPIGVMPLHFPPHAAGGILFPYEIAVVTPEEFERIEAGYLRLPGDWHLDKVIRSRNVPSKAAA